MSSLTIKPKITDDGKAKCSHEECPQYRKSTFEQYQPSTCEVGGGAGYTPENLCVTWYLREVKRMGELLGCARIFTMEQEARIEGLGELCEKYVKQRDEYKKALERCGDWVCCQEEELGSPCYELGHSDDWCPLCYGHAMVNPGGVPARKLREEKSQ